MSVGLDKGTEIVIVRCLMQGVFLILSVILLLGCGAEWQLARESEYLEASAMPVTQEQAVLKAEELIEQKNLDWAILIRIEVLKHNYYLFYDTPPRESALLGVRMIKVDGKMGVAEIPPRY